MEAKRLASQMRRSYEGIAWHGPSLRELLDGVTAEQAAAKPAFEVHTIWELLHHVQAWQQEALSTLEGKVYDSLTGDADWPPVRDTTADAWRGTLERLQSITHKLVAAIRAMDDEKLNELVGGREFNYYFLLHGIVQHNLYHAGQIALFKKALNNFGRHIIDK